MRCWSPGRPPPAWPGRRPSGAPAGAGPGARRAESWGRVDRYPGEPAGSAAAARGEDARAAADAAGEAFAGWSQTPPGRRRELLQAAAALLTERAQDIAGVVTAET